MKVYTAEKDSWYVDLVRLWGFNVAKKCTKAVVWLGVAKCGRELGLGSVDVLNLLGPITSLKTRRIYGPIYIKFKESNQ